MKKSAYISKETERLAVEVARTVNAASRKARASGYRARKSGGNLVVSFNGAPAAQVSVRTYQIAPHGASFIAKVEH